MAYFGEIISLVVAISWTATALFADGASNRIGALPLNVIRMLLSMVLLALTMWIFIGAPYPRYANGEAWMWLMLSGLVGYVFGDYCLFNSYVLIGSRFGQLFMTLAPPVSAFAAFFLLGETIPAMAWLAMAVTVSGIGMSILAKGDRQHKIAVKLPMKGILFGIGAGVGQGVGLVLSKVGMNCYEQCIPADAPAAMDTVVPFASTFIRAVAGAVGFLLIMACRKEFPALTRATRDRKAMVMAFCTTFCGPFIGVSLSLMAVQYTQAGIASTLMALTPVLIIWPHAVIFHKKVTVREVIGAVVSIIGVALFFL